MASSNIVEQIQDSYLSCSICFQPFNRPKALPCLHTFCEGCLRDYMTSRFEGTGQFPCPLCRQTIFVPVGGVGQFPDNHFIVGLCDTVHQYDQPIQNRSIQSERTPLLPGSQQDHFEKEKPNKLIRSFGDYGSETHQFIQANGIATSPFTDDIFVTDSVLNRISVFSSSGHLRTCFQCDCSIRDVAVTKGGTLMVTVSNAGNALLREYTAEGKILASYGTFYSQEHPFGVAVTSTNQPVVSGLRQNCIHVLTAQCKPSIRFGSKGRGTNHFTSPYFLTVNTKDDIIVSDCGNSRIKIHRRDGTFLHAFGKQGSKVGELFYPMGICVDKYNNIYVADANNYRVQIFSAEGESLGVPITDTFEYGIDVKPINVTFCHDNILLVVLRGSKFCQVQSYICDVQRFKPFKPHSWMGLCFCCRQSGGMEYI